MCFGRRRDHFKHVPSLACSFLLLSVVRAEIEIPPHGDFHNSEVPLSEGLQS